MYTVVSDPAPLGSAMAAADADPAGSPVAAMTARNGRIHAVFSELSVELRR